MSKKLNNVKAKNPELHNRLQQLYKQYKKAENAINNAVANKSGFDTANKPEDKAEKKKSEQHSVAESSNKPYTTKSNVKAIVNAEQKPIDNDKPLSITKRDIIKKAEREKYPTKFEREQNEMRRRRLVNFRKMWLKRQRQKAAQRC